MPTQGEYGTGPCSGPAHCCGSGWAAGHGGCGIVPQTWSHCRSLSPCSDQLRGSPDIFAECPTLCLTGNRNGSPSPSWEGSPTFSRFYPLIGNFAGYTSSTSSKTPPLVLSSALPAIPGKVVETIRAGGYIDLWLFDAAWWRQGGVPLTLKPQTHGRLRMWLLGCIASCRLLPQKWIQRRPANWWHMDK